MLNSIFTTVFESWQ